MTLLPFLLQILAVVAVLVVVALALVVGPPRAAVRRAVARSRDRDVVPYLGLLVGALLVNAVARRYGPDVSWLIGWNVTGIIYALEGTFIVWLQTFATPSLTAYFSFVYVYGYVFVLVFPLLAYAALDDPGPLRETALAYSLNYVIGLTCYILLIAHGPRNYAVGEGLLYANWPLSQLLTSSVNSETNVFPSLHASLSLTVALLAYRTRDRYPRWLPIAAVLAASITLSTMYLGIHWATDVVAGGLLAVLSVAVATRARLPPIQWDAHVPGSLTRWRR